VTLSVESLTEQTAVGLGVFAAAQEYVRGARAGLPEGTLKTFIATGNPLPFIPATNPMWLGLNIQKLVQWRLVELFTSAYSKENFRFVHFVTLIRCGVLIAFQLLLCDARRREGWAAGAAVRIFHIGSSARKSVH
jgi:hypothetical protein